MITTAFGSAKERSKNTSPNHLRARRFHSSRFSSSFVLEDNSLLMSDGRQLPHPKREKRKRRKRKKTRAEDAKRAKREREREKPRVCASARAREIWGEDALGGCWERVLFKMGKKVKLRIGNFSLHINWI